MVFLGQKESGFGPLCKWQKDSNKVWNREPLCTYREHSGVSQSPWEILGTTLWFLVLPLTLSVCLPVRLSTCLPAACLSVYLSACLSACLLACLLSVYRTNSGSSIFPRSVMVIIKVIYILPTN